MNSYRYADVDGTPHAFMAYVSDGFRSVHVVGSFDRNSGKPNALGSACHSLTRNSRKPITLMNRGADFWTVRGHLNDRQAIAAIVNR